MTKRVPKDKIKKLPSGEKVRVDAQGDMHLISESPLRKRLTASLVDKESRHQELHQKHRDLVQIKKDSLDAHPSVSHDKRIV